MAVNKSGWNKSIKVSQSTIDDIKKMGMASALKLAKQNSKASQSGMVKEYQEATRRLYGEKRFAAATGKKSTVTPPKKATTPTKPGATKPAPKGTTKPTPGASTKPTPKTTPTAKTTAPAKKSGGVNLGNIAKVAGGTAAAVGVLALTKGKGTGLAAKLAPQLAKSGVGKALLKTTASGKSTANVMATKMADLQKQYGTKALAKTGQATAKRGGAVTEAQFKAMQAAAKAKGIKAPTVDAAKNAATAAAKKAPVKKSPVKKAGIGAAGAGVTKTTKK